MNNLTDKNVSIVVTTIAKPNDVLKEIAQKSKRSGYRFIIVGDESSPPDFFLEGCEYYDLKQQKDTGLKFAQQCPTRHYSRKNIGYLLAMLNGSSLILETDDDNLPFDTFWQARQREHSLPAIENGGWVNVYRYFASGNIWPRGFALEALQKQIKPWESIEVKKISCPIQQGLADEQPDVDAIYPLTMPLPVFFRKDRRLVLRKSWCPFNSQNTTWWPETYPLLYLPSYCPFRLTDIWRSFVAQRIAYENGWGILFYEPTVKHVRNAHNLLKDFEQEVPGYLKNYIMCEALEKLNLKPGVNYIHENLQICYAKLVSMSLLDKKELALLEAWLMDIKDIANHHVQEVIEI